MEKFRAFLEVLKKYHFWVLCGLIVLLSFVSWFLATSDEEKRFIARKRQIEGRSAWSTNYQQSRASQRQITSSRSAIWKAALWPTRWRMPRTRLYDEQHADNPLPKSFPTRRPEEIQGRVRKDLGAHGGH